MLEAGIDALSVAIPKLYVDVHDFARARGMDPIKITKGLGVERIAIPDADEDAATLAANACWKLLEGTGTSPQKIGKIVVATESSLDEAKGLNAYLLGMLEQIYGQGSFSHCGGVEYKFACVAGSYALHDVLNWIRAGENEGQAGVVVASDIARYAIGSTGEYTQGAGAVAMLIKERPRLVSFDNKLTAFSVSDDRDFFRPFGYDTPVFDGHYSNWAYLKQVCQAFRRYKAKALNQKLLDTPNRSLLDATDFVLFHLPYPKMAKNALCFILREDWRGLAKWKKLLNQTALTEPPFDITKADIETVLKDKDLQMQEQAFRRELTKTKTFHHMFHSKVESTTYACSQMGNLYNASIFMALASLLSYHPHQENLAGKRLLFCSYGSGSQAMTYSGTIAPHYREGKAALDLREKLKNRQQIQMEDYERLHRSKHGLPSVSQLKEGFVLADIGRSGVTEGYRRYRYLPSAIRSEKNRAASS